MHADKTQLKVVHARLKMYPLIPSAHRRILANVAFIPSYILYDWREYNST